ncbi:MAG TPA: RNA degradosome polyphosphate kinase, partial [Candidatus Kapabacteria bacterium]|nr:RNA degradosome polyphosphate kinase [Candidatus Kapabacteria bacterium]
MNKSNKTQTNTIDFYAPQYYLNRELSLIEFNRKVLLEATGNQHPLLERLKFVCIFSSNLDEFFMIRVAGLKSQIAEGVIEYSYDGKTPREQLTEIRNALLPLYQMQEKLLIEEILPELR